MLLAAGLARALGAASQPRLRFGEDAKQEGAWAGRRCLTGDTIMAWTRSPLENCVTTGERSSTALPAARP